MLLRSSRVDFQKSHVLASDADPPVRLEMACRMHLRSTTRYQALYIDGITAALRFVQVPDVESIFRDRQSHIGFAQYTFPKDRNGFVCHLINLVRVMRLVLLANKCS